MMQAAHKARLIQQILELFRTAHAAGPNPEEQESVRAALSSLVDAAMVHTQEVDSRRVTILLSDLRGFTAVSEQYTALEMVEALNRYFERMSEIIIRYGGTIDKFMGDSIMALFGAPIQRADDIEAALACAIEMQQAMGDINVTNKALAMAPLYMGIGINTGEVVAGHLGSALHSEYTVIGDQVNLASRVEAHSLRGQILLSANTYQLASDYITVGDVNEVRVKGKKGVVRMYELLATQRPFPMAAPPREVRNSPRVQVDMSVNFQIVESKTILPTIHVGRVVDMSYGGMYIVSPVIVHPFGDLKITLALSLLGADLTDIYAKALRVSAVEQGYECRLEFTSIDSHASLALKEFVDGIVEIG